MEIVRHDKNVTRKPYFLTVNKKEENHEFQNTTAMHSV